MKIGGEHLSQAILHRQEALNKLLIEKKKDIDVNVTNVLGHTPLYQAIQFLSNSKQINWIELLLKKGANPNAQNRNGDTALHFFSV